MPNLTLGNVSVIESYKPDQGLDVTLVRKRADLGNQETMFYLPPLTPDDAILLPGDVYVGNTGWDFTKWLTMIESLWTMHSDKDPAWVECDNSEVEQAVADKYGCQIGRPKNWRRGASHATPSPEKKKVVADGSS